MPIRLRFRPHLLATALALAMAPTLYAAQAAKVEATVAMNGTLEITCDSRPFTVLSIGAFDPAWKHFAATVVRGAADKPEDVDADKRFEILGLDHSVIAGHAGFTVEAVDKLPAVGATYAFTPSADVSLNSLHVSADFDVASLAGGTWNADGKSGIFPTAAGEPPLFDGLVRKLSLSSVVGSLAFAFAEPTHVLLQDNRRWGGQVFSVRIGYPKRDYPKDKPVDIGFVVSAPGGMSLAIDRPPVVAAGKDWIPLTLDLDIEPGSALDFSRMGLQDGPAGSHGRVVARADGHFAFANDLDTPRRFYGVNLCFTAQYLAHADADRLAERLMRLGYNALRVHHYEGELVGHKSGTLEHPGGADWVPEKIDQLDYLLAACAKRGIYVTTDLYVSRPVSPEELGLATGTPIDFKICVPVLPAAWENWRAFSQRLLTHVNPYNGLRWGDDPALAWIAMINEGNFENYYAGIVKMPQWTTAWNAWLATTYPDRAAQLKAWGAELSATEDASKGTVALPPRLGDASVRTRDCLLFLAVTERNMYQRMTTFLRKDLGCKALFTNTSSWWNRPTNQMARALYDYVDDHFYVDHPEFLAGDWRLPSRNGNRNPMSQGAPGGRNCAFTRVYGKPFTITEFNYSSPGRYRGVGGLLGGALAALQDWDGIWRFAYSHNRDDVLAPHAMDYFNLSADPLNQAADRAALLLFLRRDLAPARHHVAIAMSVAELGAPPTSIPVLSPSWNWMAWITGVGTAVIDENHPLPKDVAAMALGWPADTASGAYAMSNEACMAWLKAHDVPTLDQPTVPATNDLRSETRELWIDGQHGRLTIDTPRTAGGFAANGEAVKAAGAGVDIAVAGVPATVFVSSLDAQPIRASSHLLVTHLTDLQNTGVRFGEAAATTLLDWGKLPHLVRAGTAEIKITLKDAASFKVWGLTSSGKRRDTVATTVAGDVLTFTADVTAADGARMLYEIAKP